MINFNAVDSSSTRCSVCMELAVVSKWLGLTTLWVSPASPVPPFGAIPRLTTLPVGAVSPRAAPHVPNGAASVVFGRQCQNLTTLLEGRTHSQLRDNPFGGRDVSGSFGIAKGHCACGAASSGNQMFSCRLRECITCKHVDVSW